MKKKGVLPVFSEDGVEFIPLSVGWQVCPKCHGQGLVWFPCGVPYNETYTTDGNPYECDVCQGKKIISIETGLPPNSKNQK